MNQSPIDKKTFIKIRLKQFWNTFSWAIIASVVTLFICKFVIFIGVVPSESMESTIMRESFIIGNRLYHNYQYEDILIFDAPDSDTFLVKRVIGKGGDTISFDNGKVIRNGKVLDEPYAQGQTYYPENSSVTTYTVPEGMLFMMGDNREHSLDARYWSTPYISEDAVYSKVILHWKIKK